ncbi:unnamed protein product [Prorocentrum cordatum]|uniref:Inner centromere protein ARK-binding domain-containing protein n=1 Tax=Prorocentrum cordatum TaxID=2364126 RepID=A0ABN9TMT2_9DINO|nr:unnamed protein product [Polarella glacialis]
MAQLGAEGPDRRLGARAAGQKKRRRQSDEDSSPSPARRQPPAAAGAAPPPGPPAAWLASAGSPAPRPPGRRQSIVERLAAAMPRPGGLLEALAKRGIFGPTSGAPALRSVAQAAGLVPLPPQARLQPAASPSRAPLAAGLAAAEAPRRLEPSSPPALWSPQPQPPRPAAPSAEATPQQATPQQASGGGAQAGGAAAVDRGQALAEALAPAAQAPGAARQGARAPARARRPPAPAPRPEEPWRRRLRNGLPEKAASDNYEISDKGSDSDAEEPDRDLKPVPEWSTHYLESMERQHGIDPDTIFGGRVPRCDLDGFSPTACTSSTPRSAPSAGAARPASGGRTG